MAYFNERLILTMLRWTARVVGIALLILIATFAVGEGVPNPLAMSVLENLLTIGILTMLVGQLLAWKWEGLGGLLIVGGFALFAIVNHGISFNIVFGPWLATGLMYLICWWRSPIKQINDKN